MDNKDKESPVVNHYTVNIWPDFIEVGVCVLILIAVFYYTGMEISFEKKGNAGIYIEFDDNE